MGKERDQHLSVGYKRYLGVSPFSEVSLIGTEGGRGIHNVFWIVLSSSGSFFLSGVH